MINGSANKRRLNNAEFDALLWISPPVITSDQTVPYIMNKFELKYFVRKTRQRTVTNSSLNNACLHVARLFKKYLENSGW